MKMNKLAAGALALALGLGAVAPAVAAETKSYTGAELFLEKYEKDLKKVNDMRLKAIAAQEKIDAAAKRLNAAKARVDAADKAYKALFPMAIYKAEDKVYTPQELARMVLEKEYYAVNKLFGFGDTWNTGNENNIKAARKAYEDAKKADKTDAQARKAAEDALVKIYENNKDSKKPSNMYEKQNLLSAFSNALEAYIKNDGTDSKAQQAYNELVAALGERTAAQSNYDAVLAANKDFVKDYNDALDKLTEGAKAYGYVVQIGNNGLKLVKDGEAKIVAPKAKKDTLAELKRAKADAETAIKAVALLKELSPEKIKNVEAQLNAKVAKAEELIKKADAKIAELSKVAFVATAYAAEEDDTDALIKELDSTTGEIKELIKDKPEEKKPEEKKPEEKKPEEKTPSKKAGNNARTGIAGVAGVAGILAAASVAYAASKRD